MMGNESDLEIMVVLNYVQILLFRMKIMLYSSHNGFRIKSEIKLSEYNCNQDLVFGKTKNQIGFSIY